MNHGKIATLVFDLVLALALAAALPALAAVPSTLNYQGQLTSAAGAPVSGTVSITFKLYDVASGGTARWTETQTVTVSNGQYNVTLGRPATPLDPALFTVQLYLGITVGTDAEMSPRIALSSAPYAFQSSGIVACNSGITNCAGTCSNLSTDASNCGRCGIACAGGHACVSGACQAGGLP
jgi:hypothetical protein